MYRGVLNNRPVAVKKLSPVSESIFMPAQTFIDIMYRLTKLRSHLDWRPLPGRAASSVQPRDPNSENVRVIFWLCLR